MLNQGGITKTSAVTPNQIDMFPQFTVAAGIVVSDDNYVTVDSKKIVKAGTPLYGDLTARGTKFEKATTTAATAGTLVIPDAGGTVVLPTAASSNAVGVLLHDVDVTNGDANGTLMVAGYVNLDRLDVTTAALITAEVKAALKGNVTFMK